MVIGCWYEVERILIVYDNLLCKLDWVFRGFLMFLKMVLVCFFDN